VLHWLSTGPLQFDRPLTEISFAEDGPNKTLLVSSAHGKDAISSLIVASLVLSSIMHLQTKHHK